MEARELFNKGISYEKLLKESDEDNKNKINEVFNSIDFEEKNLNRIKSIDKEINVLMVAELWCPDCIMNVPAVKKMQEINSNIRISIVDIEENRHFFSKYAVEEKVKIPTFVFYNEDFKEIGSFIEKPSIVKDVYSKNDQVQVVVTTRNYRKGKFLEETLTEILDIIGY